MSRSRYTVLLILDQFRNPTPTVNKASGMATPKPEPFQESDPQGKMSQKHKFQIWELFSFATPTVSQIGYLSVLRPPPVLKLGAVQLCDPHLFLTEGAFQLCDPHHFPNQTSLNWLCAFPPDISPFLPIFQLIIIKRLISNLTDTNLCWP